MATIEHGDFEWDDAKAAANEKKHSVTFVEAATVFDDVDVPRERRPARFGALHRGGIFERGALAGRRSRDARGAHPPHLLAPCYSSRRAPLGRNEIPELSAGWFERAVQPNRRSLRRGSKRAVFIAEEVAGRFGNDEELEQALRALLEASDHVRPTG